MLRISVTGTRRRLYITLVDGHLLGEEYIKLIRNTKFIPIVGRYCGQNSPRWHETLEQEALLLYPLNSGYRKITSAAFAISDVSPAIDVREHLENYTKSQKRKFSKYVNNSVQNDLEEYLGSFETRFERFLKHCFFLIILKDHLSWKNEKNIQFEPIKPKSKLVWSTPSVDVHHNGEIQVFYRVHEFIHRITPEKDWDERDFNNAAMLNFRLGVMLNGLQ